MTPRHGRGEVGEFFAALAHDTFHDFQVLGLLSGVDDVAARIVVEVTVASGGRYRDEALHWWRLRDDGKAGVTRPALVQPHP